MFQKMWFSKEALVFFFILLTSCCANSNEESNNNEKISTNLSINQHVQNSSQGPPTQLNCTTNLGICKVVCNETSDLPWSSTFCDKESGTCICDCRDNVPKDCKKTPFTPCFQDCVRKNPNPDVYLYEGGNCPVSQQNGTIFNQCACECSVRNDYIETNEI